MKAGVLREVGTTLQIEDVQLSRPGPREVLIRTAAAGCLPLRSSLHRRAPTPYASDRARSRERLVWSSRRGET